MKDHLRLPCLPNTPQQRPYKAEDSPVNLPNDEEKLVKIPLSKGDKIIFYVYLASLKSTILNEDVLNFFDYTANLLDEK